MPKTCPDCGQYTVLYHDRRPAEKRPVASLVPATGSDAVVWTDEELKAFAGAKCLDIFDNMTEADAMASPWWIRQAWNVGKAIKRKHQNSMMSEPIQPSADKTP